MMEKISAILICKESQYPAIVMERLTLGFFDEIIVETECKNIYRRYELAKMAANPVCYFQDSDCLVNYQQLYKKYDGRITNTMTDQFQQFYEPLGCTLMGWGSFFNKDMLSVFDKYIAKYGIDQHLLREADRIFTYLNKPFNTIMMPHEDLKRANDNTAMWKEPEHFPSAYEAINKCKLI